MSRQATAKIDIEINQKNIPMLVTLAKRYVEDGDVGSYLDLLWAIKEESPGTVGIITTNQDVKKIAKAIIDDSDYSLFRTLLETISGHDHLFALIPKQIKKYMNYVEGEYGASDLAGMISILPSNMVGNYFDRDRLKRVFEESILCDNPEDVVKLVQYSLGREDTKDILTFEIIYGVTLQILQTEVDKESFPKSRTLSIYTEWLRTFSNATNHFQDAVSQATAKVMETKIPEYQEGLTGRLSHILREYPFALNTDDCSKMCVNILTAESKKSPGSNFSSSVRFVIYDFYRLPQFGHDVPDWVKNYAETFMTINATCPYFPPDISEATKQMLHDAVSRTSTNFRDANRPDKIAIFFVNFSNQNSALNAAWGRVNLHQIADDIGLDMATIKTATPEGRPVTLYVVFNKQVGTVNCVTLGSRNESVKLNFSVDDFRGAFAATTDLSGWAQELVQTKEPSFFTPPLVQQSPR